MAEILDNEIPPLMEMLPTESVSETTALEETNKFRVFVLPSTFNAPVVLPEAFVVLGIMIGVPTVK